MKRSAMGAMLVLLAAGCAGKKSAGPAVTLYDPGWQAGDSVQYEKIIGGAPSGEQVLVIRPDSADGKPTYRLDITNRTRVRTVDATYRTVIEVDRATLLPVSSDRDLKVVQSGKTTTRKVATRFAPDKVTVSISGPSGTNQIDLPVSEHPLDNDELTVVLAGLPVAKGRKSKLTAVDPLSGAVVTYEVETLDQETVTVPRGTFSCQKVVVHLGDQKIELWYDTAAPHRLVRYLDKFNGDERVLR